MVQQKKTRVPRLTLAQKDEIIKHYTQYALNAKEISEVMGIPHHQVGHYIKKIKARRGGAVAEKRDLAKQHDKEARRTMPRSWNRKPPAPEVIEEIRKLHAEGKSYSDISRILAVSNNTAQRYANPEYRKGSRRRYSPPTQRIVIPVPDAPTDTTEDKIDREIMMAEMRLEILRSLKQ